MQYKLILFAEILIKKCRLLSVNANADVQYKLKINILLNVDNLL